MPKTDKVKKDRLVHWIDYTTAEEQRTGSWKSIGKGFIRYTTDAGRPLLMETSSLLAYGRTAEEAMFGARKRAQAAINRIIGSIVRITEE